MGINGHHQTTGIGTPLMEAKKERGYTKKGAISLRSSIHSLIVVQAYFWVVSLDILNEEVFLFHRHFL